VSPPPAALSEYPNPARAPTSKHANVVQKDTVGSPEWKGKKRSGSTRSLPYGAPVMPVKVDMDNIVSSMSSLNMVPRSVTKSKK
jgi:hypothetical protein